MTAIIYYDRFEQSEKVMCETFYKSYHNGVVRPFSTTGARCRRLLMHRLTMVSSVSLGAKVTTSRVIDSRTNV